MKNVFPTPNTDPERLYCAACFDRLGLRTEAKATDDGFVCPYSGHPTHYGPWQYCFGSDGFRYLLEEGDVVLDDPGLFGRLRAARRRRQMAELDHGATLKESER